MHIIHHRINTLEDLMKVPKDRGIEIDIRYHNDDLVLHHDPFRHHKNKPEKLENLLKEWNNRGVIILNIKTEGIESECIQLMNKYKIKDWFFLDLSMPFFALYAEKAHCHAIEGFSSENLAVRYSEREAIEYALQFSGKASWVWVDCFTKLPLNKKISDQLKKSGFKICLVSPELQKHSIDMIDTFRSQLENIEIDAVCTKQPALWLSPLS